MNPRTIPVKRRPPSNGFFKRIHAVTRNRHQRAAITADAGDLDNPDHSARISRGFTIIVLFHIVAIALYFIHLKFLNDHSVEQAATSVATATPNIPTPKVETPPLLGPNDATTIVVAGDNYARIATREGVDEADLRAANKNRTIAAGLTVKLPPKRIVALEAPEITAIRNQKPAVAERGLVETEPEETSATPRALVVRPNIVREAKPPKATPVAGGRSYVVKSGDNLYRIAKRFKIEQTALMRSNGISDPGKLSTGMTLVIPR